MSRSIFETILGAAVILIAGYFLYFSYTSAHKTIDEGYHVFANFSGTGGLLPGDDVRISGVTIGNVSDISLDNETYLAKVDMQIDTGYQIPIDSAALISSEGLLGGRYLEIQPGAEEDMMEDGDQIDFTQAPQNLEQLLGQFIFSMGNDKDDAAE